MSYHVHKNSGVIHTNCKTYQNGKPENFINCSTLHEAEIKAKEQGKKPRPCAHCNFKPALAKEMNT